MANANCRDLTLDKCDRESGPFEKHKDGDVAECQLLCQSFGEECRFFIFNKEVRLCELFNFDVQRYKDSCQIIFMTPDVDSNRQSTFDDCYNSTVNALADPCIVSTF